MVHTGKTSVFLCAFVAFAAVMPVVAVSDHPSSEVREESEPVHPVHMIGQRVGHGHRYSHSYDPIDPHPVRHAHHHHRPHHHHHHHPHHHHHRPHHHHHGPHHHHHHHGHLPPHRYRHRKKGKGHHHHKFKDVHGYHYIYGHHPHHWHHTAHPAPARVHNWHAWVSSSPLGANLRQSLTVSKGTAIPDHQPLHILDADVPKKVLDSAPRADSLSLAERKVVSRCDWEDLEDLS